MHYANRRFPVTLNLRYMHGVLNVDEIKNQLHSLVVLCETNVLSLFSQRLDNYYQIQTKCYSIATGTLPLQSLGTQHGLRKEKVGWRRSPMSDPVPVPRRIFQATNRTTPHGRQNQQQQVHAFPPDRYALMNL